MDGVPSKIVGPDGHETALAVTNGYLSEIVNPAGDKIALEYDGGGLLTKLTDPLNGAHRFEYDGAGRLTKDTAPDNTFQTLTRDVQGKVTTVTLRTGEGRTKTYRTERTGDETIKRTITDGEGLSTVTLAGADGTSTTTRPDGTKIVLEVAPDPRFGMQSPLAQRMTLTTPGGRRTVVQRERIADLATPGAPLSLRSLTERTIVNGRAQTMRFDAAARTFTDTSRGGPHERDARRRAGAPAARLLPRRHADRHHLRRRGPPQDHDPRPGPLGDADLRRTRTRPDRHRRARPRHVLHLRPRRPAADADAARRARGGLHARPQRQPHVADAAGQAEVRPRLLDPQPARDVHGAAVPRRPRTRPTRTSS